MYAKIQAIINPDKQIEFAALPNYYPAMLLEVNSHRQFLQINRLEPKINNIARICFVL